jgi:hypothetical protein
MNEYTVIGFWWEDEPVVTGIVEGSVPLVGGYSEVLDDSSEGFRGPWATPVSAPDADTAGALAVAGMESTLDRDDDEEDEDEDVSYHVKENVTGSRMTSVAYADWEAAAFICASMNSGTPGGRYGVYDQDDVRVSEDPKENEEDA